jgi:hypothetical protein
LHHPASIAALRATCRCGFRLKSTFNFVESNKYICDNVPIKKGGALDEFRKKRTNFKKNGKHDPGGAGRENECVPANRFQMGAWHCIAGAGKAS